MSSFAPEAAGIRHLPFIAKPFRLGSLIAEVGKLLAPAIRRGREADATADPGASSS